MKPGSPVRCLFVLVTALLCNPVGSTGAADSQWRSVAGPVSARIVRIIDGDTLEVEAHPWPGHSVRVSVRLRGIDTPERRSQCADQRAAACSGGSRSGRRRRRFGQRRGVAQRAEIVLGDLAQDAAHDLAGAGLRQARRPLDQSGEAIGPISGAPMLTSSLRSASDGSTPSISVT
jgi:hypothetical protein